MSENWLWFTEHVIILNKVQIQDQVQVQVQIQVQASIFHLFPSLEKHFPNQAAGCGFEAGGENFKNAF